jgi:prepilin-type N-terminal cleavage/methylation domain-containing protein/prepilin-type processing-associated H-X9-DG protein
MECRICVKSFKTLHGFTLLELLVAVAIIALLAALLLASLSRAKGKAQQASCMSNLRQINLSVRMYAQDSDDALPPSGTNSTSDAFTAYVKLMKSYVGVTSSSPARAKVFACPADTFYYDIPTMARAYRIPKPLHDQPESDYSSYAFNGGNFLFGNHLIPRWPGVAGRRLSSVKEPSKTLLVLEFPALVPYSWHQPAATPGHHNNARCMVSFVDGHVSYLKMYWDSANAKGAHLEAWQYDPPAEYGYKWSGE